MLNMLGIIKRFTSLKCEANFKQTRADIRVGVSLMFFTMPEKM